MRLVTGLDANFQSQTQAHFCPQFPVTADSPTLASIYKIFNSKLYLTGHHCPANTLLKSQIFFPHIIRCVINFSDVSRPTEIVEYKGTK
jgi:hypothetical protein